MSQGLRHGKITLEYSLMRAYLVDWIRSFRTQQPKGLKAISDLAIQTHRWIKLICDPEPTLAAQPSSFRATEDDNAFSILVDTEIKNLEAIKQYGRYHVDAALTSLGGEGIQSAEGLPEIFERFAATPDVEGAKQWITEAVPFMVKEMASKDQGIEQHIGKLIEMLRKVQASLSQEDTEDDEEEEEEEEEEIVD